MFMVTFGYAVVNGSDYIYEPTKRKNGPADILRRTKSGKSWIFYLFPVAQKSDLASASEKASESVERAIFFAKRAR